jgi:hypothetical protein
MKGIAKPVYDELDQKKALDTELEKKLMDAISRFKAGFKK